MAEQHSEVEKRKHKVFDGLIEGRWGTSINLPKTKPSENDKENFKYYKDDDEPARVVSDIEDTVDVNGKLLDQQGREKDKATV